ncbi:MAG: hypothetical protein ACO38E_06065 [Ilumatobacteraceae bacterium]
MRGAWRWIILITAIGSVGIAFLREQRADPANGGPSTVVSEFEVTTTAVVEVIEPIPEWCEKLLTVDETTPLDVVAQLYLEVAVTAGGVIERDLTAAAIVLSGQSPVEADTVNSTVSTIDENFDAEGRFVEDDAVLRAGQQVDEICKRTSLQAAPAATAPE